MIYVMSDLHGCYDKYIQMLNKINFNNEDTLYILGYICDRGGNPIKILLHMMNHDNIIPIFGNHDVDALISIEKILNNDIDNTIRYWLADGGNTTLDEFEMLDDKLKRDLLVYLSDFRYYQELTVNNIDYVLVHGGLKDFNEAKSLDSYNLLDLVWTRPDYDKVYYKNRIIISGHTPTLHIDSSMKGKIIKKNNHIAIDTGCVFGYGLACICLDNMEEYYV